jgi:NitT/TauT family transport system permease protein
VAAPLLLGWEGAVRAGLVAPLFFPAPSTVALTIGRLAASGQLPADVAATLARLLLGFAIGASAGLLLGLAMGWSPRLRAVADPLVAALHPIPKIAVLPLVMVIFGIGEPSKLVVIAVSAFFPMLLNAMAGVRQINPLYFEVAHNSRASTWLVLRRVVLPGSLPLVLTGARLALNIALLLTIAVEMVAAREGLGAMIWLAWETLRTEYLFAGLVVVSALGISFNRLLLWLTRRAVPWQVERQDP